MKITVEKLTPDMEAPWDEYVAKKTSSIYHYVLWRKVIRNIFGHKDIFLYAKNEDESIVGVLPLIRMKSVLFGDYLVSVPYFNYGGVISDSDDIELALLEKACAIRRELGCGHLEIRDIKKPNVDLTTREDKVTVILDLPPASEELWKAIGSKRRAQIKRPIREGVEFKFGKAELLDDFYYVFSRNMRDLGTPVYSKKFFSEIFKLRGENSYVAIVYHDKEPVSCAILLGDTKTLEIPWASTLSKVNRLGVNMFLYWKVLEQAIELKYRHFDFGRSSKDSGTLKFKKQWGGQEKQLYWIYDLDSENDAQKFNPKAGKYKLIIAVWKKLPLFVANRLGPYIVKGLP